MYWKIDPAHTRANFSVRHMMISWVHGTFDKVDGDIEFDPQHPQKTRVDVQIAADSINTREAKRDAHLKSPDFLDAEKYPALRFTSKHVEILDETHARLTGELTIRDITHQVVLDVEYSGMVKNTWGSTSAGFSATTEINRKDWDLTWNVGLETGGVLVGDMIKITIELELVQLAEPESVAEPGAA